MHPGADEPALPWLPSPRGVRGGLALDGHKAESIGTPLRDCPLPPQLVLPLRQHAGAAALPCVEPGARVAAGDCIAQPGGAGSVALHAPASARVLAIEPRPTARGLEPCIVLEPDGEGRTTTLTPWPDWRSRTPDALRARLAEAGVVGLGGAMFPTAVKNATPAHMVVLNGAECEPWISCDDALLRTRPDEVLQAAALLRHLNGAAHVCIALEDSMTAAFEALRSGAAGLPDDTPRLLRVPTRYPQGGERQLIESLTGRALPPRDTPAAHGIRVQNVATAVAAWRAVVHGEPLTHRIVTVTGPGVAAPCNLRVAIGTPVAHVIAQAGGYTPRAARLLLGGPMMGTALPHDAIPLVKGSQCVLVLDAAGLPEARAPLACIRCGDCARACPAGLQPQLLWAYGRAGQEARQLDAGLMACIECGCCDLVCPSAIPLTAAFRHDKATQRNAMRERDDALAARERFEAREARLARLAAEREARLAERRATVAGADAVQAAIARARARRGGGEA